MSRAYDALANEADDEWTTEPQDISELQALIERVSRKAAEQAKALKRERRWKEPWEE